MLEEDFGGKKEKQKGVTITWFGGKLIFLNVLTFDDGKVDRINLEKRLTFSADYIRKKKEDGVFFLFEELLTKDIRSNTKLQEIYDKVGFTCIGNRYGMTGDISNIQDPYHPDLEFKRVSTQKDLDTFHSLNALAQKIDPNELSGVFIISKLWREIGDAYIGYLRKNDQPVCCGATFPVEGCLALVSVATDPDYWRLGYGKKITRKVLFEGSKAYKVNRVEVQSSKMAKSLYERMGMKVTCNVHALMLRKE